MHIILNSLRYALWLVFCLFRHAVFVPAAFGGVCLLARLVFSHPVSDLNDQLQKEATAWRTAPPGHYMWEECPVPDNAVCLRQSRQPVPSLPSPQKPRRTITCCHCGPYGSFFILSNVLYVLWRLLADALRYHSLSCREAGAGGERISVWPTVKL